MRIWLPTAKYFFWLSFFNSDFGQGRRVGVCGRRDSGSSDGEPCVNLGVVLGCCEAAAAAERTFD